MLGAWIAVRVASMPSLVETVVSVEPLMLPGAAEPKREDVALSGALRLSVFRASVAMPQAMVELEPLSNPPMVIVHNTSSSRGSWRELESLRPCSSNRIRRLLTSNDGLCAFEELPAGLWICRSLGEVRVVTIKPGEVTEEKLHVDAGTRLARGLVLDERGQAIADAPIWVCCEHLFRVRQVATRTNASGRFELAVAPYTTVGALHAG